MTTTTRRGVRLQTSALAVALAAGLCIAAAGHSPAAGARTEQASSAKTSTKRVATSAKVRSSRASTVRTVAARPPAAPEVASSDDAGELSFSDEYERAELVERMLAECRGIDYNAYELARTSGESLWLPAPIQLFVVRVRHPYCAELVRTYAPKQDV